MIIKCGSEIFQVESYETPTVKVIQAALSVSGGAVRWGNEIYFEIDVRLDPDSDTRADLQISERGYWPPGFAFCIFFDSTPMSTDCQPGAASPVNGFGKIASDVTPLKPVQSGEHIEILSG